MLAKLTEMKRIAEESKERLNHLLVEGEAGSGLVVVTMTGNREVRGVKINSDLKMMEPEDLEDLLCVAIKRALDKANALNEQEVVSSAKNFFPGK